MGDVTVAALAPSHQGPQGMGPPRDKEKDSEDEQGGCPGLHLIQGGLSNLENIHIQVHVEG